MRRHTPGVVASPPMDLHRLGEERSLAYHRVIAARLVGEPALVEAARATLGRWIAQGRAPHYLARWREWLALPPAALAERLRDESEEARTMRR